MDPAAAAIAVTIAMTITMTVTMTIAMTMILIVRERPRRAQAVRVKHINVRP
jgi:hypothetical protein